MENFQKIIVSESSWACNTFSSKSFMFAGLVPVQVKVVYLPQNKSSLVSRFSFHSKVWQSRHYAHSDFEGSGFVKAKPVQVAVS